MMQISVLNGTWSRNKHRACIMRHHNLMQLNSTFIVSFVLLCKVLLIILNVSCVTCGF